jgi:hypothetical protein
MKHVAADIEFLSELRAAYQRHLQAAAEPACAADDRARPPRALEVAARPAARRRRA